MADQFDIEAKLKITGVDVKGDLDAGTLKFNVDTSALKKLVRDAGEAAKKVKTKFDNIKLSKIKLEINQNSLRSAEAQIRKAIQNAVKKTNVQIDPTVGKTKGGDPFKEQRKAAQKSATNLDKLNQATRDVSRGLRSLAKTLGNLQGMRAAGGGGAAPAAPGSSLPVPAGATTISVDQLLAGDRKLEMSSDRMTAKRLSDMQRLAAAGDRAAQQRVAEIERIKKRVDSLAQKELRLAQQLQQAGGAGGFGGGRGGPPGGFGATPPGGEFDKSKGSVQGLQRAMSQLEMSTRSGVGAMRDLDDLAFEVGKKAAAFRGVAIAINTIVNASQAAARFLVDFNDSLLELNKILQFSDFGLQAIGNQLFRLSSETGVAVDQTVDMATTFARAGLAGRGYGSVVDLATNALTGLQGTTLDAAQATTIMIQVIQQVEANARGLNKELITTGQLFDILGRAEDITASKAQDVAEAFKRSAASVFATGASIDQATALISVLQERTQRGGEVIGTALKTLAARTSNSASEASKALQSIGVATVDAQGRLRNTFEVLADTARAFNLLTEAERANISVKVAGVRQVEILRAALLDFNRVQEVQNELASASGDAARKQAIEQQKLATVIQRTQIALQELVKNASEGILGEVFAGAIRGAEALVRFLANLDNKLSGSLSTFAGFIAIVGGAKALFPLFKGIFKAMQTFINQSKGAATSVGGINQAVFQVSETADKRMNKAFMRTATVVQSLNAEIKRMAIENEKAAAAAERLAQARLQAQAELGQGASPDALNRRTGRIMTATDPERIAQRQRLIAINRQARSGGLGDLVRARQETPEVFSAAEIRKIDQLNEAFGHTIKRTTALDRGLAKLRVGMKRVLTSSILWGTGLSVLSGILAESSQAAMDAGDSAKGMSLAFLSGGTQAAALGALIGGPWTAAIFGVVGGLSKLVALQKNNGLTVESLQKQYESLGLIQKKAGDNAAFAGKMIEDAFKNVERFRKFLQDDDTRAARDQEINNQLRGLTGEDRAARRRELEIEMFEKAQEGIATAADNLITAFDRTGTVAEQQAQILAAASDAIKAQTGQAIDLAEPLALKSGSRAIRDLTEEQFNTIIEGIENILPPQSVERLRERAEAALVNSKVFSGTAKQVQDAIGAQVSEFEKTLQANVPTAKLGIVNLFTDQKGAQAVAESTNFDKVIAGSLKENRRLRDALQAIAAGQDSDENRAIIEDIKSQAAAGKLVAGALGKGAAGALDPKDIQNLADEAKRLGALSRLAATSTTQWGAALSKLAPQLKDIAGVDLAEAAEARAREARSERGRKQIEAFKTLGDQLAVDLSDTAELFGREIDPLKQELRKFIGKFEAEVMKLEQATIRAITPQEQMATALRQFAQKQLKFAEAAAELNLTDLQRGLIAELNKVGGAEKRIGRTDGGALAKGFGAPALQAQLEEARRARADTDAEKEARTERIKSLEAQLKEIEKKADVTFGEVRARFVKALITGLEDVRKAGVTDQRQTREILGQRLAEAGPIPEEVLGQEDRQKTINKVLEVGTQALQSQIAVRSAETDLIRASAAELKQRLAKQAEEITLNRQRAEVVNQFASAAAEELTGIRKLVAQRRFAAKSASISANALKQELDGVREQIALREKALAANKNDIAATNELVDLRKQEANTLIAVDKMVAEERIAQIRAVMAIAQEASNIGQQTADRLRSELSLRSSISRSLSVGGTELAKFNAKLKENSDSFRITQAQLAAEVEIVNRTIKDETEKKARLKEITDKATQATLEAADAEAQIIAERREAVKQLAQELVQNQQQQVEAQKAVIDATKAVGDAFEGYMQAVDGAIMATTQYNLNLALVEVQNNRLLGGFTGLREQLASVQDVFRNAESAARDLGASEKTLVQLRRQSIDQQLSLFNQLLSEQSQLARSFFTSSAQDQADLFLGINEAKGVADILGGSFEAFKSKGEQAINDLGSQILSLPQETRQRVVEALETLQKVGGSVGGFTADELLNAIETASLGVSGEGLEVDPLFQVQERIAQLSEEQARLATEGLISANEGVEVAKQQLQEAEAAKDLAEIQLERVKEEGEKLRGKMGELRGDLKTTLLRQDQTNRTGFNAVTSAIGRVVQAITGGLPERFSVAVAQAVREVMSTGGIPAAPTGTLPGQTPKQTAGSRGSELASDQRRFGSNRSLQQQFYAESGAGVTIPTQASSNVPTAGSNLPNDASAQRTNELLDRLLAQLQDLNTTSETGNSTLEEIRDGQSAGGTSTAAAAVAQAIEFSVNIQGEQRVTVTGFEAGVTRVAQALAETFGGFATEAEAEQAAREIIEPILTELVNRGILQRNQVS